MGGGAGLVARREHESGRAATTGVHAAKRSKPGQPERIWMRTIGDGVISAPVVVGDLVYVASQSEMFALRTRDGTVVWSMPAEGGSPPAVTTGVVCVASGEQSVEVYAVRASDGRRLWNFQGDGLASQVANGIVYVTTGNPGSTTTVNALRVRDGKRLWSFAVEGSTYPPAVFGGIVYVSPGPVLSALRADDGKTLWTFSGDGAFPFSVANGLVYVTSGTSPATLSVLRASDGAVLWSKQDVFTYIGGYAMAVAGNTVYVGASSNRVDALRSSDGSRKWSCSVNGSPILAASLHALYVADGDLRGSMGPGEGGRLSALRSGDGQKIWSVTTGGVGPGPLINNDVVFSGGGFGYSGDSEYMPSSVYALRTTDGRIIWRLPTVGIGLNAPVMTTANEVAYIGDVNGSISAMRIYS